MKKLFLFLTILIASITTANAQFTPYNNLNYVKLLKDPLPATKHDSVVLFNGTDKYLKMMPVSTLVDHTEIYSKFDSIDLALDTVNSTLNKKLNLPTGFLQGLQLSINADPTKFNIAPGYYVVTDFTNLASPVVKIIAYPGATGLTPAYLASANSTYVALDINGNVVPSASPFTDAQRRTLAIVGNVVHSNNTTINVTNEIKAPIVAIGNQLHDFMKAIGFLNESGNIYSPNGANLQINKSLGEIWGMGINAADYTKPHKLTIGAQTALTFAYRFQNGTQLADTQNINPNIYDVGGTSTATPTNKWTIQRINLFQSGLSRIQPGQTVYNSFNDAVVALPTQSFVTEQNIADNAIFRCYLIVQQGTTNLTSAVAGGTAQFVPVDKFGNIVGNGAVALTYANIIAALGYTPENVANKSDSFTASSSTTYASTKALVDGLGVSQAATAYVDVNGNNATAILGNIKKPYSTIDAALDALPAGGGIVKIGIGSFSSPTPAKIKTNTAFIGAKEPVINSTVTISAPNTRPTISAPTALVNGTILTGEFSALDKTNIVVSNLGIDVGKTWVDTFNSGTPVGGLVIASITATTPVKNIQVSNVTVLGYAPATAQHCMLFENIVDSKFNNLSTYYHVHGIALKGLNITMDGLNLHSHNNDGLIIKSDTYAPTRDVSVNNVNISSLTGYDGGGIILEEGVNGSSLLERVSLNNVNLKYVKFGLNNVNKVSNVNISNFNLYDSQTFGIKFDNNVDKINLSGLNIVQTTTDGIDVSITGSEVVNIVNSNISDATGIGYKLTTAGTSLINIVNSNTLNTTASYLITGTGIYGSSNFGTGTLTGYINFKNNFVKSNGRIFSTDDSFFGDLASTNGTLDMRFSNSSQVATIESYNFTTSLMKPLEIKSLNFNVSAAGQVSMSPATLSTHGVTKAQLDASANSGIFTPTNFTPLSAEISSLVVTNATYTKIGNIVTVSIGYTLTVVTAGGSTGIQCDYPIARTTSATDKLGTSTIWKTSYSTMTPGGVDGWTGGTFRILINPTSTGNYFGSAIFQYSTL